MCDIHGKFNCHYCKYPKKIKAKELDESVDMLVATMKVLKESIEELTNSIFSLQEVL